MDCIKAGESVPVYPNAPKCCAGLVFEAPARSLIGLAGTCEKGSNRLPSNDKKTQQKPEIKLSLPNQMVK